ncbi:hypothetical protein CQA40_05830 [Helicobacter sp. MIT 01-3238]|nr:hypothetical protein CQA40_05830 [Helicobacter sp. MIT 01-3238]
MLCQASGTICCGFYKAFWILLFCSAFFFVGGFIKGFNPNVLKCKCVKRGSAKSILRQINDK